MSVYGSVVADLSTTLLDAIPGTIEDKLFILQSCLVDSDIVIQYVCGEDDSVTVQIRGTLMELYDVQKLLGNLYRSLIPSVNKDVCDTIPKQEASENFAELEEHLIGLETARESGRVHLCEVCGEEKVKSTSTCEQACQTELLDSKPSIDDCPVVNHPRFLKVQNPVVRIENIAEQKKDNCDKDTTADVRRSERKRRFNVRLQDLVTSDVIASKKTAENEMFEEGKAHIVQKLRKGPGSEASDKEDKPSCSEDIELSIEVESTGWKNTEDEILQKMSNVSNSNAKTIVKNEEKGDDQDSDNDDDDYAANRECKVLEDSNSDECHTQTEWTPQSPIQPKKRGRKPKLDIQYEIRQEANFTVFEPLETGEPVVKFNETRGRKRKGAGSQIAEGDIPLFIDKCIESQNEMAVKSGNSSPLPCLMCDYTTSAKRHLRAHVLRCHIDHKTKCKICGKTYGLQKDLRAHLQTHFPKLECSLCDARLPNRTLLDHHIKRFHTPEGESKLMLANRPRVYTCPHCVYITRKQRALEDHVSRIHGDRNFECIKCNKRFALEKDMNDHMNTHTDVYKCSQCEKRFRNKSALHSHVRRVHFREKLMMGKSTQYICDTCGKICRNRTAFTEHMNKEHFHIKPYNCPLCTMSFHSKVSLKSHLLTHGTERKYRCKECDKTFKLFSGLKVHQAIHLEYKYRPYSCDVCNKTFAQRGALVRHQRIHTGEKPYPCRMCDAAFNDYSILRRHMLGVHKINSRDLCQRTDVLGNKGGPKPERVVVEDLTLYQKEVRNLKTVRFSAAEMVDVFQTSGMNDDSLTSSKIELSDSQGTGMDLNGSASGSLQVVESVEDCMNTSVNQLFLEDPIVQDAANSHGIAITAVSLPQYYVQVGQDQLARAVGADSFVSVGQQFPYAIQTVTQAGGQKIAIQLIPQNTDFTIDGDQLQ